MPVVIGSIIVIILAIVWLVATITSSIRWRKHQVQKGWVIEKTEPIELKYIKITDITNGVKRD